MNFTIFLVFILLIILVQIVCSDATNQWNATTFVNKINLTENVQQKKITKTKMQILSRRRRYVAFPEGSSFSVLSRLFCFFYYIFSPLYLMIFS